MHTDYTSYKDIDFLDDDFFVESMISPTKESEKYWSQLIDQKLIDINEFISANMLLDTIRKNWNEVSQERKDRLWQRIESSKKSLGKKHKRASLHKLLSVAACGAAIIGLGLTFLFNKNDVADFQEADVDYAQFKSIDQQESNNEIRIVSENNKVEIDGEEAEIKYDSSGLVTVNNKEVDQGNANPSETKTSYNQLYVPYGKRATLTLSDGSALWVNAGTTVVYPTSFANHKREIYVEGEVYAEVQRDENRPFLVKTEQLEIEVLGTAFNLSAYEEDAFKRIVLVNGAVDVKQEGVNTRLAPNQSYTYTPQGNSVEIVDTEIYTSWRNGIYIFQDEPIENILLKLARYYNATMIFPQQQSGTLCSGKLELKEDLPHLLNHLSHIASFSFGVKDKEYRIFFN